MTSWIELAVADVAEVFNGKTPAKEEQRLSGHPVLKVKDINELGEYRGPLDAFVEETLADKLRAKWVRAGDTLILNAAHNADYVGSKTYRVEEETHGALATGEWLIIRPNQHLVDPGFLNHWVNSPRTKRAIREMVKGIHLYPKDVARLTMRLPQLGEQRRIADVLDRAATLRVRRRAAMAKLETLKQSIFLDMFGGAPLPPVWPAGVGSRHPSGWSWELLTDVSRLATGHTPDRTCPDYWDGEIPWITTGDIRRLDGKVATDTKQRITALGVRNSSAVKLPSGTVCFCRTASVGFVTMMGREMTTSQDFVNWVCGPMLDPAYLLHAFLASRDALRNISDGSTHKTIYFPTVEKFRVLVPPRELQALFVDRISALRPTEGAADASAAALAELARSLEQRAFSGAL